MNVFTSKKKLYSAVAVKGQMFAEGFKHALHDGFYALIPVLVAGAAATFLWWFWSEGPVDLVKTLFGVKVPNLLWARILSTVIVGLPTLVFVKQSFRNMMVVLNDPRPMERELDHLWDNVRLEDKERRHG